MTYVVVTGVGWRPGRPPLRVHDHLLTCRRPENGETSAPRRPIEELPSPVASSPGIVPVAPHRARPRTRRVATRRAHPVRVQEPVAGAWVFRESERVVVDGRAERRSGA